MNDKLKNFFFYVIKKSLSKIKFYSEKFKKKIKFGKKRLGRSNFGNIEYFLLISKIYA